MLLRRPVQTRFPYGYPTRVSLATHRNSQAHSSKGTRSRHTPGGVKFPRLVGTRFQVLFHDPSPGCFSPFPHGTGSLSVASEYLVLPDGPGGFKQGFSCPALLRSHWKEDCIFTYAAVTLSGRPFQTVQLMLSYPSFNQATSSDLSALPA